MKKKIGLLITCLFLTITLSGCHQHEWIDATCTEPKHCTSCDETEGEALGHKWIDATCTEPKTCSVCGEATGAALGHKWVEATCVEPKTCSVCGETEGKPDKENHNWKEATCTESRTCSDCGATEGDALGHQFEDGICTVCGEENPVVAATYDTLEDHRGEKATFDVVVYDTNYRTYETKASDKDGITCNFHAITYDGINYINPFVGYDISWGSVSENAASFVGKLSEIKDGDILTLTVLVPSYYTKLGSIQAFDILDAEITGNVDINEVFNATYANAPIIDYDNYMRNDPTYNLPVRVTGTITYVDGVNYFVKTGSGRVVVQDMNQKDEKCLVGDTIDVAGQSSGFKDWIGEANGKLPLIEGNLITRM